MEQEIGLVGGQGLTFFGKTNRIISHELKNILAIISETLGLINELLELAETTPRLDAGKIQALSVSVLEEVDRANTIIRTLNSLAHCVDELMTDVDLTHELTLCLNLVRLDRPSREITIQSVPASGHFIKSSPFFLVMLLYEAMHYAVLHADPAHHLQISLISESAAERIVCNGLKLTPTDRFPVDSAQLLARSLAVEIYLNPAQGEMHLVLPKVIGT